MLCRLSVRKKKIKTVLKSPRRRKCGLIDDRCAVKVVVKITALVRGKNIRGGRKLFRERGCGFKYKRPRSDRMSSLGFYHKKRHLLHVTVLCFRRKFPIRDLRTTDLRGTSMNPAKDIDENGPLVSTSAGNRGVKLLSKVDRQERRMHRYALLPLSVIHQSISRNLLPQRTNH